MRNYLPSNVRKYKRYLTKSENIKFLQAPVTNSELLLSGGQFPDFYGSHSGQYIHTC